MKQILFVTILSLFALSVYSEEANNKEDPFESFLPAKQEGSSAQNQKPALPPPVEIQGVLWGSDTPQTIIDGEVYKVGDTLKNVDGKVYKIEKNTVSIFYEGRLYEMKVMAKSKKEEK
jgi:hypothetical protein